MRSLVGWFANRPKTHGFSVLRFLYLGFAPVATAWRENAPNLISNCEFLDLRSIYFYLTSLIEMSIIPKRVDQNIAYDGKQTITSLLTEPRIANFKVNLKYLLWLQLPSALSLWWRSHILSIHS